MSMYDDDTTGAIDTGNSPSPPISGPDGTPPATAPQPAGLPDVGPPLQDTIGPAIGNAVKQGISNFQQDPLVQGAMSAGRAIAGTPSAPSAGSGVSTGLLQKLLGGEGALSPQLLDNVAQKVDPQGKMTPADRQVAAIHDAYEKQGPDAAMAILQANRVAYGTKAAFARTALLGNGQKPADLNAAIQAANQAQENLPDGSNIVFSHGGRNGITATVTMPGSNRPVSFNLSPQQFAQFLDVGGDGQFDKLMDVSAPAMLQRLVQANAGAPGGGAQIPFGVNQKQVVAPEAPASPKKPYKWGENSPSSIDLSGETSPRAEATDEQRGMREPELEGKAARMFPWASQDQQKQQWMSSEEEKEATRENAINVAKEKGKNDIEKARVTGTGRVDVAKVNAGAKVEAADKYSQAKIKQGQDRLAAAVAAEEAKNGRNSASIAGRALNAKIAAGGFNSLTDKEKATFEKFLGGGTAPQAATPQAPTPQAKPATGQQSQLSGKDQQAMAWAKANPNDPRAAQIMARLNGAQ